MPIKIRNMQHEDIKEAANVFNESFNSVGEKWNLETAIKRIEQYFCAETCWVAENESHLVGVLISKSDNVLDHQELYIDVIAVDPKNHKNGIGTMLLNTAENYAKEHGYAAVWLTSSSELPSFNWYIKTGFTETNWKVLVKNLS